MGRRQVTKPRQGPGRFPIKAVSALTGIGIDTLRAWERRHGAVTPARDGRGRMYSDADIARLRLLRGAVERGHAIGRLAGLTDEDLRRLTSANGDIVARPAGPARPASLEIAALIEAMRSYDSLAIDAVIARLTTILRPVELVQDVLMPVLVRVGDDWRRGKIGIAHEHLMSSTIRHAIGAFLRRHMRRDAPVRLLFATLSGDRHEIGTLGATMLAASCGLGVAYLGPDLPAGAILESVGPSRAQVLVLGLTLTTARRAQESSLRTIVRSLPNDVELWTGGPAAGRHASIIRPRGLIFDDYAAYQRELGRLGGRVDSAS
jgi:methanogenic corrinoid protein MtbC1